MSPLPWSTAKSVGIRVIDEQHGILLDALNELRAALKTGEECECVRSILTA